MSHNQVRVDQGRKQQSQPECDYLLYAGVDPFSTGPGVDCQIACRFRAPPWIHFGDTLDARSFWGNGTRGTHDRKEGAQPDFSDLQNILYG